MAVHKNNEIHVKAAQNTKRAEELVEELAQLREQLSAAHQEISALKDRSDRDGALPVLQLEAFKRSVGVNAEGKRGCLARITITNLSEILSKHGDEAGDLAVRHVAEVLAGHIRDTDTVGRIGTGTFGLILAYADQEGAIAKLMKLIPKIEQSPIRWNDEDIPIVLGHTVAPLGPTVAPND